MLEQNEIVGSLGDGVASWNNCAMAIHRNSIHANHGAGIAVNTGGGAVTIANNAVFDNVAQPVSFATNAKLADVRDNTFESNEIDPAAVRPTLAGALPSRLSRGSSSSGDGVSAPASPALPPLPSRQPSTRNLT